MKLLALSPRHRLHRDQAIEALWPRLGADAGAANLRKAIHFARRALGGEEAVGTSGGIVALWPEGDLTIDVEAFQSLAARALEDADADLALRADRAYRGELLPEDAYAEWAQGPRERLRQLHLAVLRIARRWEQVVEEDPRDEEAHRELMRLHLRSGNRQEAMRQFERLRNVLMEDVGVGPDPQTVALYEEILAMEGPQPSTPAERAAAHLSAGLVALHRMDLREAEGQARRARELAIDAALPRELGEASGLLGMVAHARSAWPAVFREEFLQAVGWTPDLAESVFDAHLCLAEFSLIGAVEPEEIAAYARDLLAIAEGHDSIPGRALAHLILGESELIAGDVDRAEADLSLAAELHGRAGATSGRALALERLAGAATARGRRARARRLLADAQALALQAPLVSHLLVRIYGTRVQAAANTAAAAETARQAREDLGGRDVCTPCSIGYLVASATAFARSGSTEEAATGLDQAERVAGMWQGGPWLAAVWEARAELRLASGEQSQAAALFQEAADLFARHGHRPAESRCRAAAAANGLEAAGNVRGTRRS